MSSVYLRDFVGRGEGRRKCTKREERKRGRKRGT
jgi:hypothetical protein